MQNKGRFVAYYRVSTEKQGDAEAPDKGPDAEAKDAGDKPEKKEKERGLGMDAQVEAVERYISGRGGVLIQSFREIESGRKTDRTQLNEALRHCRLHRAVLIVAKLDRLSRNSEFLLKVVRESGERGVVFCDLPDIPEGEVGKMFITMMAGIAAVEAEAISKRTKAALAALKLRLAVKPRTSDKGYVYSKLGTHQPQRIIPHAKKGGLASGKVRRERARQRALDLLPAIEDIRSTGATTLAAIAEELNAKGITALRGGRWASRQVLDVLHYATADDAMKEAA
jgi:DNA invertase Pin-like site-specific DNA recombinase